MVRRHLNGIVKAGEPNIIIKKIYYEYFGLYNLFANSERIYGQRYTAWSNIDGTEWHATERIPEAKSKAIRTEQGNMQVVGNKIYYGYPQNEVASGKWQLWTAESNLDGTGWKAVQRTAEVSGRGTSASGRQRDHQHIPTQYSRR